MKFRPLLVLLLLLGASLAWAGHSPWRNKTALGPCVADADTMRRKHMDQLKHQRDNTVRLGQRGQNFSLQGCLRCHADAQPEPGQVPQFCEQCHSFVGVKIDCFQCHASRPSSSPPPQHRRLHGSQ